MGTEEAREAAAASLRTLSHTFAAHDLEDDALAAITATANELARRVDETPRRDRLALMRHRPDESVLGGRGFEDRAVGGRSNPTSIELEVRYDNDDVVADVVLRRAFEGAPGRAHGGIVAAAFDDVTGFVIGKLQEPAFTGELTVRYLAPVPVDETWRFVHDSTGGNAASSSSAPNCARAKQWLRPAARSTSRSIRPSSRERPTHADPIAHDWSRRHDGTSRRLQTQHGGGDRGFPVQPTSRRSALSTIVG